MIEEKIMRFLVGRTAERFAAAHLAQQDHTSLKELSGNIGSPGYAKGRVKVISGEVNLVKKMGEMQPGDILISNNTRPDMILACNKAGAIVTNEGGILSHAALVSRELGVPCLINTKHATEVFKDGDLVEVDAIKGFIRRL